ncbi:unnamed protein product [Linum trigynum]|uniref:Uncharacterized protein n=1 Tax=Linum trigynum TaxID=586398 RepID=A0AAV2F9A8_9ROSI
MKYLMQVLDISIGDKLRGGRRWLVATTFDAWSALATIYTCGSKIQIWQLTKTLQNIHRGDATIHDYLQTAKAKADQLAMLGSPVSNDDLTDWILDGLGEDYRPFVCHIEARMALISFGDLHSLFLGEELQFQRYSSHSDSPAPTAFFSITGDYCGRGGRGRGRGSSHCSYYPNTTFSPFLAGRARQVAFLGPDPLV